MRGEMSDTKLTQWLKDGKHLPEFMRDFHDQKRIFKRLDEVRENDATHRREDIPNWISAHIYVIDFFLWYMGRRGYTLQKSRAKHEFTDIHQDLADFDKRELEELGKFINELQAEKVDTK
jgi:hypothetical protein